MSETSFVKEERMVLIVTKKDGELTEEYLGDDLGQDLKIKLITEILKTMKDNNMRRR